MRFTRFFALVGSVALSSAWASFTPYEVAPTVVTSGSNASSAYNAAGAAYSGVAMLTISRTDGTFVCSGAAISATAILTAGHCLTNTSGVATTNVVTASFSEIDPFGNVLNSTSASGTSFAIHPLWGGNVLFGVDLAVVTLNSALPSWVSTYGLYKTNNEIGQVFNVAGYGMRGSNGQAPDQGLGVLRQGRNTWDMTLASMNLGVTADALVMDFDNGTAAQDGFAYYGYSRPNLGIGANEVNIAPGDSGGPSFINGMIAGVNSFSLRRVEIATAYSTDIDGVRNGSYGEFAGMARVSPYVSWIQASANIAAVPEPSSMALMAGALALLGLYWRR